MLEQEVEEVLRRHPAVRAACVVGVPHPEWGEQVAALVAIAPDIAVTPAELQAFCRERLADYKVPEFVTIGTAPLPRNALGKLQKDILRRRAAEPAR